MPRVSIQEVGRGRETSKMGGKRRRQRRGGGDSLHGSTGADFELGIPGKELTPPATKRVCMVLVYTGQPTDSTVLGDIRGRGDGG